MSSQRYSLSEELAHVVCSKRHLPALLSVMAGTVCPLCHQNKAQANTLAACIWLGAAGNSPHLLGDRGWLCNQRRGLGIPGVHRSQIF